MAGSATLNSIACASRLVVDTGLHAKRWTREQARQFFLESVGDPNASEVDRYCNWRVRPAATRWATQAINRERDKAKAALGARFDLKAFNDAVVLEATCRWTCSPERRRIYRDDEGLRDEFQAQASRLRCE